MTTTTPTFTKALKPPVLTFVTPEMAAEWLQTNTRNRNMRIVAVDALARDMTEGNWQITGDPVKFDVTGSLIDGQHRLSAIVRSKETVPLFVMRDLPTTVQTVIDTGLSRTAADALKLSDGVGSTSVNVLAASARLAMIREAGGLQIATEWTPTYKYTNTEIIDYLREHPKHEEMVHRSRVSYRVIGFTSNALWNYLLVQMDQVDSDAALEFETALVEMHTNGAGDPRATLLKWVRDTKVARLPSRAVAPRSMFAVARCWNAWRTGQQISKIQIGDGTLIPVMV